MTKIPDLRNNPEITLEHCYVLIQKLEEAFSFGMEESDFFGIAEDLNPVNMKEYYELSYTPEAFHQLFTNDIGKGVLIGSYAALLLDQMAEDLEALDDEDGI